ncbi:ABC transporter substrate-binding protein [[Pasteurella] aerogenes]
MLTRNIIALCTFLGLFTLCENVAAAPKVPEMLTQNGLVYCTYPGGFSFNPQTADAGTGMNVITEQIYNKLFEIKNNSEVLVPVLATSYSVSADGKIITIHLRRGVKFHKTPWFTPTRDFNADDVVFSLNRVLGQNMGLPELDQNIKNYSNPQYKIFHEQAKKVRFPYFESIRLNEKIESVKAINPYQVQITLFAPDSSILSHLASQYAIIFSQEYAVQLNSDDNLVQLDLLPVGTGPYQVKDYFRNQYVRLIRNNDYWKTKANIENIVVDLSTERSGRLVKFFNNECQIVYYPEVTQLGLLQKNNKKYDIKSTEGMNLAYIAFNLARPSMQNVELRRAISHAINRERIVQTIYHQTATVANNIIPSISWAANINTPDFDYDYDPPKAQAYFKNRKINLNLWVLNEEQVYNPSPIKTAELIKADLAKVGVMVNIRLVTRTYLMKQLKNQNENYDMILAGWLGGNLDPDSFIRPILGCDAANNLTNLSNWCYRDFEEQMDSALTATGLHERAQFYNQAQAIMLRELPLIPLANVKRVLVVNAKVQGIEMTPFGIIDFSALSIQAGETP